MTDLQAEIDRLMEEADLFEQEYPGESGEFLREEARALGSAGVHSRDYPDREADAALEERAERFARDYE